jgi:hypothetical protein
LSCAQKWLILFRMSDEKELTEVHPMGEREPVGDEAPETTLSLNTLHLIILMAAAMSMSGERL